MTIIRTFHDKENPYTTLNNQALLDPNLSNAARGLWAQCMARKDDWTFYMSEIRKNTTDGKHALGTQINELIQAGYVARLQIKQKMGRRLVFKSVDYIFFESKITPEKKQQFLEHFKKQVEWCEFLEPKDKRSKEDELKNCLSQPDFPVPDSSVPEKPPLVNTNRESTDEENTEFIIAPDPEPQKATPPKPIHMPAGGNNNIFFKCLDKCEDLSDRQKRMLMRYPENLVNQAVRYCYHPTTQIKGGPVGRIKLLQFFLQNPDDFKEHMENLDKPRVQLSKKEALLSRFKNGEVYNGYEFLQDNIGVGFLKPGMNQPYSVRWDAKNFVSEFLKIIEKIGMKLE